MRHFNKNVTKKFSLLMVGAMLATSVSGCGVGNPLSHAGEEKPTTDYSLNSNIGTGTDTDALSQSGDSDGSDGDFDINSKEVERKTKEIEGLVDKYFYFDEDEEKREESYYDGIMKGLDDPYSVYYTKKEYEKMLEDDSGEFQGIGATVSKNIDDGTVYIVQPIKNSPAEKAGLLPNDVIVAVDDLEVTSDMELDFVVDHIRGDAGTDVVLKIYREGEKDFLYITVTRDVVQTFSVESEMLDDIGYVRVSEFIDNTPKLFKEAVDDVQSKGAKGMIVDLRGNPGGSLNAVIEMLDYIVDDNAQAEGAKSPGMLLEIKDKNDNVMDDYVCSDGHSVDIPMVVLVNGNSASASEIFSGCVKDYGIATVMGTKTYGKGIVQSIIPLKDGSAIKVTIAKYFLPSGADIHKVGVEPDVEVELAESLKNKANVELKDDNQVQEAIKKLDK
ncbi:MAG: S41 family peptidase [Eubacterium sp.]|nr:S41 family peptidase [Eubacterium sp.]